MENKLTSGELFILLELAKEEMSRRINDLNKAEQTQNELRSYGLAEPANMLNHRIARNQKRVLKLNELVNKLDGLTRDTMLEETFRGGQE